MERVSVENAESADFGDGVDCRRLSDALGTTDVAINRYRVPPGEGLPGGLHAHADQEEIFVVVEGEATFETLGSGSAAKSEGDGLPTEGREVTASEGEAIRFAPGEFQSGRNDAHGELVALAIGAPRATEDVRVPAACPECSRDDMRLDTDGDALQFVCPDCGVERVPRPCPECGRDDMRITLGEATRTVVVCRECGAEFDRPPLRE